MNLKEIVAEEIAKRTKPGQIIGVGTGSTVDLAIKAIAKKAFEEKFEVWCVPTSIQTAMACEELGLGVLSPLYSKELDWGFDGADAVDSELKVIKGKGGALLQEKILAKKCKHYCIVVDDSKVVDKLSEDNSVPVEVIPEARGYVEKAFKDIGATQVELRVASAKHGPVITEAGNLIIDVNFKEVHKELEQQVKSIVGVVESGLFIGYANEVLVGTKDGIRILG